MAEIANTTVNVGEQRGKWRDWIIVICTVFSLLVAAMSLPHWQAGSTAAAHEQSQDDALKRNAEGIEDYHREWKEFRKEFVDIRDLVLETKAGVKRLEEAQKR